MFSFLPDLSGETVLGGALIIIIGLAVYIASRFAALKRENSSHAASLSPADAEKLTDSVTDKIVMYPHWWSGIQGVPENFEEILRIIVRSRVQQAVWKFFNLELPIVRMRSPRLAKPEGG